jgi:hypothetical protein
MQLKYEKEPTSTWNFADVKVGEGNMYLVSFDCLDSISNEKGRHAICWWENVKNGYNIAFNYWLDNGISVTYKSLESYLKSEAKADADMDLVILNSSDVVYEATSKWGLQEFSGWS